MGKITDSLYDIYVTQGISCGETMLCAGIGACQGEAPADCRRMMSGFSGGVSSESFCGAVLGGVATIGYEINRGDEESFERSKEATQEFVALCRQAFGSLDCHDIKGIWRQEDIRCYRAVEMMAIFLDEVLEKYGAKGETA